LLLLLSSSPRSSSLLSVVAAVVVASLSFARLADTLQAVGARLRDHEAVCKEQLNAGNTEPNRDDALMKEFETLLKQGKYLIKATNGGK
jgi:hypothetical protein